ERLPERCSVALYRSDMGEAALAAALSARFELRDIRAYTAAPGDYAAPRTLVEAASAFAFTSAAGARAALERLAPLPEGVLLAALGAPTARALAQAGGRLITAAEPSARALAEAIAENIM
ncbi:MAG TPA: uroporphyrinogen-III synthase, partial [Candidatus Scatomorpha merdipullorum]|nr:uroporphyrinogen-III synthase [Candidatus Scatomorpha merdipullorum]